MRKSVNLEIDGNEVKAKEGMTIMEAAKEAGIEIPTLCYHEELAPYGACYICGVEVVERNGRSRIVASCGYPVEASLRIKTHSPKIAKMRRTLIELVAPRVVAGGAIRGKLRRLADEYGANTSRFASKSVEEPIGCILCGLCVRYCSEVMGMNAIGFVGKGIERQVTLFPEKAPHCYECKACYKVCPTGKIAISMPKKAGVFASGFCISDYLSSHGVRVHSLSQLLQSGRSKEPKSY